MPLDAGAVSEHGELSQLGDSLTPLRPTRVVLKVGEDVGAALREAREGLGLAVEDIAQATRVRPAHITALEAFDLNALPARPFVIGYVRAYARALGLETEAVVARFRAEAPSVDDRLRAPSGLRGHGRGFRWLAVGAAILTAAVVAWNITRHIAASPRHHVAAARRVVPVQPAAGPAQLGAPLPTPPEAAAPPTYQTPGLSAPVEPSAGDPVGAAFVAAGPVYGATGLGAHLILQARKPTSLVVRGPDGAVYFARQLAAGEAWRAPEAAGLVADVGNPASMQIFVDGLSRGDLTQSKTPLSTLTTAPPTP